MKTQSRHEHLYSSKLNKLEAISDSTDDDRFSDVGVSHLYQEKTDKTKYKT